MRITEATAIPIIAWSQFSSVHFHLPSPEVKRNLKRKASDSGNSCISLVTNTPLYFVYLYFGSWIFTVMLLFESIRDQSVTRAAAPSCDCRTERRLLLRHLLSWFQTSQDIVMARASRSELWAKYPLQLFSQKCHFSIHNVWFTYVINQPTNFWRRALLRIPLCPRIDENSFDDWCSKCLALCGST